MNISPSSDHEQIDVSHVCIILANFFKKIGTVLNEFSRSKSFTLYFFWPPFKGAGDCLFDMIECWCFGMYYLREEDKSVGRRLG